MYAERKRANIRGIRTRKKGMKSENSIKQTPPLSCVFLPSFTSWISATEDIDLVQPVRNQNFTLACCWVAGRLNFAGVPLPSPSVAIVPPLQQEKCDTEIWTCYAAWWKVQQHHISTRRGNNKNQTSWSGKRKNAFKETVSESSVRMESRADTRQTIISVTTVMLIYISLYSDEITSGRQT